jgi:hypothetical protein
LLQRRTDQLVADSRANPPVPAASNSAEAEDTELSDTEKKKRVVPAVQVVKQAISRPKVLGEAVHDPVDTRGKTDFGIAAGEVLQLKYVDKEPPVGFHKFVNQLFTCKVRNATHLLHEIMFVIIACLYNYNL